jgi:ketosteroid isomerase-like protein
VAGMLETSEASVNSALQRARTTLAGHLPGPDRERAPLPRSARERDLAGRFATAFADGDMDALVAMLTEDAWFTMPPAAQEYQGPAAIGEFLRASVAGRAAGGYHLVPTRANGQVAFGCYVPDRSLSRDLGRGRDLSRDLGRGRFRVHGTIVLTLEGDKIAAITRFVENGVMRFFGLPLEAEAAEFESLGIDSA